MAGKKELKYNQKLWFVVYKNSIDMQAFKAANPSASFADFIRWY